MNIEVGGRYQYKRAGATAIVTVISVGVGVVTVRLRNGQVYQVPASGLIRRIG
jgi:hypothetical protein